MDQETEKRIRKLESEVRALREEVNELKGVPKSEEVPIITHIEQIDPEPIQPIQSEQPLDAHLVQLNKAAKEKVKKPKVSTTQTTVPKQEPKPQKEERSFEEIMMRSLPKIFMVILVLGVLWGLKLVSDYGLLSNTVKIILAYMLSIGLMIIPFMMEKRKKSTSDVLTVVLYGGAFIVGILTTAAGAILYSLLSLTVALVIAVVYIAYGIAISYVKKNEVLSVFVIFTSLLLPYLLEYMDFDGTFILLYVLIVYAAMQFVFIKHRQKIALYLAYFFSIIAVQIIWQLNVTNEYLYLFSYVVLNAGLLFVWIRLYNQESKLKTIHEGLLFSLSGLTIFMMNTISDQSEVPLLLLMLIFGTVAFLAYKRNESRIVDIIGTISLLLFLNVLVVLRLSEDIDIILLPLSAFIGLMLAIKIGATLMKITYTTLFTIMVALHLMMNDVEPLLSIEHVNYYLILIYLVSIFLFLKRRTLSTGDQKQEFSFTHDFFPIVIVLYFFIYVLKIDFAFVSNYGNPYLATLVLPVVMLGSFFVPEKFVGKIVRYVLVVAFLITSLKQLPIQYVNGIEIWLDIIVRLFYAAVVVSIIADILMEGYLYRTWIKNLKVNIDGLITISIALTMLLLYSLLSQFDFEQLLDDPFVVAGKTILLFATATISLWLSTARNLRITRIMGFVLLILAILKLIFIDLASLSLLIRAILFISIGAIGLFLSNRLLINNRKEEE